MTHQWPSVTHADRNLAQLPALVPFRAERAAPAGTETTADAGDLFRILRRRRGTVIATAALFVLVAAVYSFLTPSLYTATSQLLIDPRDRQVVSNDLNNAATIAPDGGITVVESQVRVIESDSVLLRAIADAGLETDPEFGGPSDGFVAMRLRDVREALGVAEGAHNRKALALRNLRRKLAVKRADKVFVVDVIVTAKDPEKSARIVNAIARAYLADQAEARSEAAKRASGSLAARLDSLRSDVRQAETQLEEFRAKNGLIASSGRLVAEQQLTDSNARLVAARNRTVDAKNRLENVRDARGASFDIGALPEAIQSITIERLRNQYAELASREAELQTQLGTRHPGILAVHTQKVEVKRLIDAELNRIVQAAEVEYQRAQANERALSGNLDGLRAESVETSRANVQLRELDRAVEATRSVYNSFLVRSREIGEQANIDPTNARVITWAQVPEERSWPLRGIILAAALAGGLGFGAGLAMLREYSRPTLLSRRHFERLLGAPVIAAFPRTLNLAQIDCAASAAFTLDSLQSGFGLRGTQGRGTSVLFTGAPSDATERRELIDLLATTASQRGEHVLVVEADLSAPSLGSGGLLEVLRGEASLQAVVDNDLATGARRIAIGNGQKPVRDAFDRTNVERFLGHVGERFDLVLVDGGALWTNVRIGNLAGAVDRIVAVGCGGRTPQEQLVDLGRVTAGLGRPIFGTLFVGDPDRRR